MNSTINCCKEEFKVFYTCSEGQNSTYCFECDFRGFPYEKVVYVIEGTREEKEDGFISIIETYDYYPFVEGRRIKHEHKSLRPLTYEEAETLLERADDDIRTQLEYDTTRSQEEQALAAEDNVLLQTHSIRLSKNCNAPQYSSRNKEMAA